MNMDLCTKCFEEWRRKKRDENHEFLMKLHKQNQKKVSNCCSAKIYDELDICTSCKEHCKGVLENGER